MKTSRSRLLVGLARSVKYCIVKNLEENCLQILPKSELVSSASQDLHIIKSSKGKECHVILIHSGEKEKMEQSLQELLYYERVSKKYRSIFNVTVETQTECLAERSMNVQPTDIGNKDENLENVPEEGLLDTYPETRHECTAFIETPHQQPRDQIPSSHTAIDKVFEETVRPSSDSSSKILVPDTPVKRIPAKVSPVPSFLLDEIPPTPETPGNQPVESEEDDAIYSADVAAPLPVMLLDTKAKADTNPNTGHERNSSIDTTPDKQWDPLTSSHTQTSSNVVQESRPGDCEEDNATDNLNLPILLPIFSRDARTMADTNPNTGHERNSSIDTTPDKQWDPLTSSHTQKYYNVVQDTYGDEYTITDISNPQKDLPTPRSTSPNVEPGVDDIRVSGATAGDVVIDPDADKGQVQKCPKSKKKHFCKFCKKLFGNFSRHLLSIHYMEEEVTIYKSFKTTPEKLTYLRKIMAEGDAMYNDSHPQSPIVRRKSSTTFERQTQCPNCKVIISRKHAVYHLRNCNPDSLGLTGPSLRVEINRERMRHEKTLSVMMKTQILPLMRNDSVKKLCENDPALILYGNKMCERLMGEGQDRTIRNHLRILGRVVEKTIELSGRAVTAAKDLFEPNQYHNFVNAIRAMCGYGQAEGQEMTKPTTPHQYGPKMRDLSDYLVTEYLIKKNPLNDKDPAQVDLDNQIKRITSWQQIYDRDFDKQVASLGRKQADRRTYESKQLTPSMEDVQKLLDLIEKKTESSYNILKNRFSAEEYKTLSKCLLLRLWIFNRRRVGEVDKLRLKNWLNAKDINENSDQFKALTITEQRFASSFRRVTVQGKLRRPVALLAPKKDMKCYDLIISMRSKAKIKEDNLYLFAVSDRYIEGTATMNEFAKECGAANWRLLTGTRLRKQLAASLRYLNLTDEDLRLVAESMGHTEKTHITKYRINDPALHAGRMSRVLMSIDDGTITKFAGKSIDDLDGTVEWENVTPLETLAEVDVEGEDVGQKQPSAAPSTSNIEPWIEPAEELTPVKVGKSKKRLRFDSGSSDENTAKRIRGNTPGRKRTFSRRKVHKKNKISNSLKEALMSQLSEEIQAKKCPTTKRVLQAIGALEGQFPEIVNHSPKKVKVMVTNWSRKKSF